MSAELEKRVENLQAAINEWLDKTDWVQKASADGQIPGSLGLHRADAMLRYVRILEAKVAAYQRGYDYLQGRLRSVGVGWDEDCDWEITERIQAAVDAPPPGVYLDPDSGELKAERRKRDRSNDDPEIDHMFEGFRNAINNAGDAYNKGYLTGMMGAFAGLAARLAT